jgi:site-specific recombinase XerD
MSPVPASLAHILETHIQNLALTLRPGTVDGYRCASRNFLAYVGVAFPQVRQLSDLRRAHLLGWFRSHCERRPPLSHKSRHNYLLCLRRLFEIAAGQDPLVAPDLICQQDLPRLPLYLPKPLSLAEDRLLQQELRRSDNVLARALLLMRATGIRVGECIDLKLDCLRPVGEGQWLLHVPLGKLHTERWVPADGEIQSIIARIVSLRTSLPRWHRPHSEGLLLPYGRSRDAFYQTLASALQQAAHRAGCPTRVTPHRLRHTFASEMVRLGVGLPALKQMLGHSDIRMTMRYVEVTQLDLQREFHTARRNTGPHQMPALPTSTAITLDGVEGIRQAISTARYLMQIHRDHLGAEKERARLQRLDKRLLNVASQLEKTD